MKLSRRPNRKEQGRTYSSCPKATINYISSTGLLTSQIKLSVPCNIYSTPAI
jgi:hypothetical protein